MLFTEDSHDDTVALSDADTAWVSEGVRWRHLAVPVLMAVGGVACVALANASASQGSLGTQPLWWLGVLAIFTPAAASLLFGKLSRSESISLLLVLGIALYAVKLVYAPGRLWEFDELLHFRTVDDLLRSQRLFTPNPLLPASPFYPGMELVTAVIVRLTGLSIVQSGLVLIGVARVLMVASVFLLFERLASPPRFAAPATLLYMSSPAFLYFDAQFAYESLALALALACVFALRAAQQEVGARRQRLNAVGAMLLVAVAVTHHVTSFILVATLIVWTLSELGRVLRARHQAREGLWFDTRSGEPLVYLVDLPGSAWVPAMGVAAIVAWALSIATLTISYLWQHLGSGLAEMLRLIRLGGTGRRLFESNAGNGAPLLDRVVGIASVLIILVLIPMGLRYLWRRRGSDVFSRLVAVGALAYPATLALRLTQSGWEVGSRATAFVYIPLAFTIAVGMEQLSTRHGRHDRRVRHGLARAATAVMAASVIFAGGVVAVTSPVTRQPAPYSPGRAWVPYDLESLAAANWTASTFDPGQRFAGDSAGGTLIGSVGRQHLVASGDGVSISQLFLSPGVGDREREIIQAGRIDYVMVDRRIADTEPLKGYVYERWERTVQDYGSSVDSATVNKFDLLRDASKVFDSGNIQFFGLHRLAP